MKDWTKEYWINISDILSLNYADYWNNEQILKEKDYPIFQEDFSQLGANLEKQLLPQDLKACIKWMAKVFDRKLEGVGLDLGAGNLWAAPYLLHQGNVEKLYCLEYSPLRIFQTGPQLLEHYGIDREKIVLALGNLYEIKVKENFFDFIFLSAVFHHTKNPENLLKEINRVLKADGLLLIIGEPDCDIFTEYMKYVGKICFARFIPPKMQNRLIGRNYKYNDIVHPSHKWIGNPEAGDHFYSFSEYKSIFRKHGFEGISIRNPEAGSRGFILKKGNSIITEIKRPLSPVPKRAEKDWSFFDSELARLFLDEDLPVSVRYNYLFSYFIMGWFDYMTSDGAHLDYPGYASHHGRINDLIEGFVRVLPMIGAWLSSGRPSKITLPDGTLVDLFDTMEKGLGVGTDMFDECFWGFISDHDQKICESADVALSVWLLRNSLWENMPAKLKNRIIKWLNGGRNRVMTDNNWHLMPIVLNKVLESLGYEPDRESIHNHYKRFKSFYRGSGWFSDGPGDIFDYYNAWGIHYSLFWLDQIDPKFDPDFIRGTLSTFIGNYKHLISPKGVPITGRSIGIRMATPVPLIAASLQDSEVVFPGLARRALDCIWRHFIGKGAVKQGNVTQGYWESDPRFLENYCGPATGLWSLRSLVLAFYCSEDTAFWNAPEELLPVEKADFKISIPEIGWTIIGKKQDLSIQIIKANNIDKPAPRILSYSIWRRLAEYIRKRPYRPDNHAFQYRLTKYDSNVPFFRHGSDACRVKRHRPHSGK